MEVLQALKEPEKEDDTDGYWWRGLKPMLKELDPVESLKFKHNVTGLLLTYVERAKTKKKLLPGLLMTDLQILRLLTANSPWQPAHPEKNILLIPDLLMTDLHIPCPVTYSPWQPALPEKSIEQRMSSHRHALVQARVPAVLTVSETITNINKQK
ncbi:hypothetical protein PoB_002444400 [Plakobranchus ocellatus]|uniref:Uncharacterized protein n=1 Tax=Plakobranchus ocellatus TaxID=259542 RepID=A0AAV3ZU54_9GAST|nr:hypothetical protein PoB_002444400 [Plakobranchus ocellatus]